MKIAIALGALMALTVAGVAWGAGSTEKVVVGNLEFSAGGGFSPKTLSKTTLTPIAFTAEGKISTLNGEHPPALKEVLVEADKNTAVDVKGFPVCRSGQLQSQDTAHAEAICKSAIIGKGETGVEIAFAESKVVPVKSKLLVFNGGVKGATTTFFIHAYITVPVPAAIVTTVKIKKIHHGRYGMLAVATIPKIAGGSGSVKSFSLKIDKKFTYKGKKVSVLSAKCPDGKLQAHATAIFADGTSASAEVIRTCTGKG
ncbi:MAG: hypothetical protein ACRDLL_17840 [Solirubrobacterales bacterium]